MEERNIRICKICSKEKVHIRQGKLGNTKDYRYTDENNKIWNGRTCPDCNRRRTKSLMFNMRNSRKVTHE